MNWLALTMEELNIIIGLVNPWPVLFQHQQRTSHPMQMASRTISSNDWLPHKWEKFYLLLHLLMIADQMPLTIIWMAALNLNITCNCCWNIQYAGKEHFQSLSRRSPLFKEYKRKKGGTLNLYTNPTLSWGIKRWGKQHSDLKYYLFNHILFPRYLHFPLPSLSVSLANNPLVSKLLRQPLGTQIALDQANLFCKGDLFNHLIFFGGHLFIWFPRLQRTLRGYSNKAGESNR